MSPAPRAARAGPTRADPRLRPASRQPPVDLETALEEALLDAVAGEPRSPLLARRLETVARAMLYRYGVTGAQVSARLVPGGVDVSVLLPPSAPRVQQINIRLGRASSS